MVEQYEEKHNGNIKERLEIIQRETCRLAGKLYGQDKFWELEKRIKKDKKHPGVIMEMSKSETIWNIVYLIRLNVIAYDDLVDFSDELKESVALIMDRNKGE